MPTALAALPSGVRVTVEDDADDDGEEVEDIGSETDTDSAEQKPQPQPQQSKKKRRKPEASGSAGLANVIRDLLSKPQPAVGCPILAKAQTDRQRFAPAAGADDADKDEDGGGGGSGGAVSAARRRRLVAERRQWLSTGRVKPSSVIGEREVERQLERLACRGVVQLFNAVRAQQRALDARLAGKSESGRQRVLASLSRAEFLDMLAGRKNKKSSREAAAAASQADGSDDDDEADTKKQRKKKSWSVLSDDYLVKPTLTMKDWDRASSDGSAAGEEGGAEPMEQDNGDLSD